MSSRTTKPEPFTKFRTRIRALLVTIQAESGDLKLSSPVKIAGTSCARKITLYYTNQAESSDKVYEVEINLAKNSTYTVDFRYGKRGSKLLSGRKTKTPVSLPKAEEVFEALVRSKQIQGYTENPSGVPFSKPLSNERHR